MSEKTIQISVYDFKNMKEYIYESTVSSVEDMIALYYKFDRKVKFKKPTDKNWYYCKTMIKRLFKNEINKDIDIRLKGINDLIIKEKNNYIEYEDSIELYEAKYSSF